MATRATALVTGASAGLGREFARQLAARGLDLVVVARDTARLEALAAELCETYRIKVEVLTADLADRAQVETVAERLADADRPIDLLVNNAGFARGGSILSDTHGEEERAVDVMVRAVLVLSQRAAQAMRARGRGRIVNVGSVAGFAAMGSYSATKSWVTVFTEALGVELAGTGVTATAICPGFVHTEFHERGGLDMSKLPERGWLSAEQVVREGLDGAYAGRAIVIPSLKYSAVVTVMRHAPRSLVRRGSGAIAERRRRH